MLFFFIACYWCFLKPVFSFVRFSFSFKLQRKYFFSLFFLAFIAKLTFSVLCKVSSYFFFPSRIQSTWKGHDNLWLNFVLVNSLYWLYSCFSDTFAWRQTVCVVSQYDAKENGACETWTRLHREKKKKYWCYMNWSETHDVIDVIGNNIGMEMYDPQYHRKTLRLNRRNFKWA